jgi:hypothetical protein
MKKRTRTNMRGLVSHSTPEYSRMSEESILRKKFQNGDITKEELRKLASFMVITKPKVEVEVEIKVKMQYIEKEQYYIKCWDSWIPCTEVQYNMAPPCARKIGKIKVKTW